MSIKIKPNTLNSIENICMSTSLISAGGFLTGALIDNEQLGLISGVVGVVSILGKYYSRNKLDKYNETPNTSKEEYPLNNSDYAKNLEHYTKIVKSILEEPKNNK